MSGTNLLPNMFSTAFAWVGLALDRYSGNVGDTLGLALDRNSGLRSCAAASENLGWVVAILTDVREGIRACLRNEQRSNSSER